MKTINIILKATTAIMFVAGGIVMCIPNCFDISGIMLLSSVLIAAITKW